MSYKRVIRDNVQIGYLRGFQLPGDWKASGRESRNQPEVNRNRIRDNHYLREVVREPAAGRKVQNI